MRRNYFDWVIITLSLIEFAGGLIYLLYNWDHIPALVPALFVNDGTTGGYSEKTSFFIIIVMEAILVGTVFATTFIPKFWDRPSPDSVPFVTATVRISLELLGLVFATFFTGMYVIMSRSIAIPPWYFTAFLSSIVGISFLPFPFAVIARFIKKK